MNCLVVAFSIVSGAVSIHIITIPTDFYYYGINNFLGSNLSILLIGLTSYFLIFPVFYKLQLTSIYSYLELRFDKKVKLLSSFIFALQIIISFPIITYVSALTVSLITNINVYVITYTLSILCIIYTIFGGIKAIIWTDALQYLFITICGLSIVIVGFYNNGIWNVYKTARDTERLKVDFDVNPMKRDTFWLASAAYYFQVIGLLGFHQGAVQKYLSLKKSSDVKWSHFFAYLGLAIVLLLSVLCGFVTLYQYVYCDPMVSKKITKPDQLISYYVMDSTTQFPGLAGLFASGIISASLSTLSSGLNSVAVTVYYDFFKPNLSKKLTDKHETTCLKVLVLIFGILCVSCTYIVKYLERNIFPVFICFTALTNGPMAGLFIVGLFIPKINANGAFYGGLSSLFFMAWLVITSQWYQMQGFIKHPTLPVYTNSCKTAIEINEVYNQTRNESAPWIYKLSHFCFPIIGISVVMLIAFLISYLTKRTKNDDVPDEYLSPLVCYIRKKCNVPRYKNVLDATKECEHNM
nr:sodium-coupled monocarboxylate transporter 2-like [Onthophagus taurus]